MKIIVDVNVWISAILWDGVPDKILQLAEAKKIQIFASYPLLTEFNNIPILKPQEFLTRYFSQ